MLDMKIQKGGKLLYFSHDREDGGWKDVTDVAFRHLFDACDLEDGVTLRDIFLLVRENMWALEPIIGNWIKEIVAEGLDKPSATKFVDDPRELEYVELYWHCFQETMSIDDGKIDKRFYGFEFPNFDGVGHAAKEAYKEDGSNFEHAAGSRVNFAIEFSPTYELIDLPVKLKQTFDICEQDYTKPVETRFSENGYPVIHKAEGAVYSLGHILYGIFYELSFCGNPEMRDDMRDELKQRVEDVKSGKAKTIPWEEVEARLNKKDIN